MTTRTPSEPITSPGVQESPWANGLTIFAAAIMVIAGFWQALAGNRRPDAGQGLRHHTRTHAWFDLTGWGWIHLLLGVIICAGVAVFFGQMWARVVGILLAGVSMIANFVFIPHYPSGP